MPTLVASHDRVTAGDTRRVPRHDTLGRFVPSMADKFGNMERTVGTQQLDDKTHSYNWNPPFND